MDKQKIIKIISFFILNALLLFPFASFADTSSTAAASSTTINDPANSTSSSTEPSVLGVQAPKIPPLIAAIKLGKEHLAGIALNHALSPFYKTVVSGKGKNKKTKQVLAGYNLDDKDLALAILDPLTNNLTITVGKQNGKTMVFPDATVTLTKFNGVNSRFSVNNPANGVIVAEKYLLSSVESGSKAAIENGLKEAIYVPYSPGLNSPDVQKYGEDYLTLVIKNVASELQNVPSAAIPGKTVTQAISPALIKALVYAEHTDTTQVLSGNVQDTINQLNVLFATNEGDAYKYSVSTASARGIAQFIPSTYKSLVARHADVNLIPDFVAGMSDHENSIKAMYLLLDDYAGAVRVKGQQGFAEGQVFDYAAAAYNGGTTRVANAVNTFGSNWNQDHSGEINTLQSQINTLQSQASSLKANIKKSMDKQTKASLQTQLASVTNQLSSAAANLDTAQSATLRNETINYLNKIYKVIHVFNDQVI